MDSFRFKQFEIRQDRCAMKVGTDGVLLGAWASGGRRILDIGSGTGLISLMMAQRFPHAEVVGIDMDEAACGQAQENVAKSPFSRRVSVEHCRLQDFLLSAGEFSWFDSIVSNPPFFVNSLKNPNSQRAMARHADTLPFRDLLSGVKRLLAEDGVFSVIVPKEVVDEMVTEACLVGFYLVRQCAVKTVERKTPKRYLLAFSRHRLGEVEMTTELMTEDSGRRSAWYQEITSEFYL